MTEFEKVNDQHAEAAQQARIARQSLDRAVEGFGEVYANHEVPEFVAIGLTNYGAVFRHNLDGALPSSALRRLAAALTDVADALEAEGEPEIGEQP